MAHYEYQGQLYELPDGISNEEALSKIKKYLGQSTSPKTSVMSDLVEGTKGTAAFAGDLLSGMVKLPAQAALAVGGKVTDPSMSLQQTWETAGQAVEDTFPSFTKPFNIDPQKNRAYSTAMKPFELYGEGLNWLAEKASFGNKDIQGAINIGGNILPIPFAGKIAKGLGKVASRLDPGLYNIEVDAANAKRLKGKGTTLAEIIAEEKATKKHTSNLTNELAQMELFDQPEMGRVANPYEAKLGDWRIDENGIPIKADLSMEVQNLQNPLQRNLWGDELEPVRNPVGQSADLFAENGMQQGIPLTQAIDSMDWAHRRNAINSRLKGAIEPSGALEGAILEATPQRINRDRGPARGVIDPDLLTFGIVRLIDLARSKGMDNIGGRVLAKFKGTFDEKSLRLAADESRDPNSRKRLVWMSPQEFLQIAEKRTPDKFYDSDYKRRSIREGLGTEEGLDHLPGLKLKADGTVWWHEGRHRMDVFIENGLDLIPVELETSLMRNKDLDTSQTITGENGTKFKFPDLVYPTETVPNPYKYSGRFNKQRGAINPEILNEGFRGINRFLSKLTDQPWVRATYGNGDYLQNQDGTPMILLHGARKTFGNDVVRASDQGIHAGFGAPAHIISSSKQKFATHPRRTSYGGDENSATIYPVVIKKGNYPFIKEDFGVWEPATLAQKDKFALAISKYTEQSLPKKLDFFEVKNILSDWHATEFKSYRFKDLKESSSVHNTTNIENNASFSRLLKDKFNIDGFFYENTGESPKDLLRKQAWDNEKPSSFYRIQSLSNRLSHPKSFVTWNEANVKSLYDLPEQPNKYAGRFNKQRGALFLKAKEKKEVSKILNLKNTPYDRVQSVEQVLQDPGKDLGPFARSIKDPLQSGLEGTLRHNTNNAGVNFARTKMQEARNFAEQLSKKYLTDSKTGLNAELNKLTTEEKTKVVGLMLELDRQEVPLSENIMTKAGFTENQKAVARKMRDASDALYAEKNRVLGELGYDTHKYREGYMPGNFGGAYKTLIGYKDKKGEFHITGVAQADTRLGHTKALEWYRKQNNDKFAIEIPMERQSVGTRVYSSAYDGWADLIQEVAKQDKSFGEALQKAQQMSKDSIASMYNFHVHEKAKKGITGSYGNRPWLSAEQNAKEFLKSYIDYLEEGYRYTSYQVPLNEINTLLRDPGYRSSHPNTVKYLEKYVKHVAGNNLNPIGAAVNWAIDKTASMVGLGNTQFNRVNRELTQASTLHMMGVFNPGFFLAQLTQWATGGIPEAAQIRASLKQDPQLMVNSLQKAIFDITALNIEESTNKVVSDVPQHMKEAYKWGHDNGLFTFSEVALAHEVLQSKLRRKITPFLDWPIRLGEQATRPTVFLAFADMFHNAGFRGEEAMLRAQAATDWAMVNYHPDERPMIYQSLGALGNSLGALSTYKHNLVSQQVQRVSQSTKYPMAAITMLGLGYALYGVSGLPGYQEASNMAEKITDKPLREILLPDQKQPNTFMDGVLSAKSGLDFQTRLSMSNVLPDSPMSAFPHISNFVNIMDKAYTAGLNWDKGNATELAKALAPAGIKPSVEHIALPKDKEGNIYPTTKEGMNKYSIPRSPEEQVIRDILGVRPLRERLEDERIWSTRKSEAKRQEKLKDALMRFDRAYINGDTDGMAKAEDDYTKNDGDITTLYNSSRLSSVTEKSVQDEATRRAGKPTKNLNTLKRYEEYTQ